MKNDEKTAISEQISNDLSEIASWTAAATFTLNHLMSLMEKVVEDLETIE
jgi:hypothetical protein